MGNEGSDKTFNGVDLSEVHEALLVTARKLIRPNLRRLLPPEDMLNEAVLKAWKAKAGFRGTTAAELFSWMREILLNVIIDRVKAIERTPPVISLYDHVDASNRCLVDLLSGSASTPSSRMRKEETAYYIAAAIASLPPAQGEALINRYYHGLSVAETAAAMGKSAAAISMLLQRGLAGLHEPLRRHV